MAELSVHVKMNTLSVEQQKEAHKEVEQELAKHHRREEAWEYRTREALEKEDPSLKDGLDKAKLKQWRRQVIKIIHTAGISLKMPAWGLGTAFQLCHRFYSKRSMKKNDRFRVATACLHLAAKMEEVPKPIREVVRECRKVFVNKTSADRKKADEPEEIEQFKEDTLTAERAILYTLHCDLQTNTAYRHLAGHMKALGIKEQYKQPGSPFTNFFQNAWNVLNDSYRTNLCLQYKADRIALGALYYTNQLNTAAHGPAGDIMSLVKSRPDVDAASVTFFTHYGITLQEIVDITSQLSSVYEEFKSLSPFPGLSPGSDLGATPSHHHPYNH